MLTRLTNGWIVSSSSKTAQTCKDVIQLVVVGLKQINEPDFENKTFSRSGKGRYREHGTYGAHQQPLGREPPPLLFFFIRVMKSHDTVQAFLRILLLLLSVLVEKEQSFFIQNSSASKIESASFCGATRQGEQQAISLLSS